MATKISNSKADGLDGIVNTTLYPIYDVGSKHFQQCIDEVRQDLKDSGKALLPGFFSREAVEETVRDVENILQNENVFQSDIEHNIFLEDDTEEFEQTNPRRMLQRTSKLCITYDQVPESCSVAKVFHSNAMTEFIRLIFGKEELYRTADSLGALNIHVFNQHDRLGWHFDRGEFAVTLLLQKPEQGGEFQYVRDLRLQGDNVLCEKLSAEDSDKSLPPTQTVPLEPGTLMLFCGHNSLHRVTPVLGKIHRIIAVLSYESKPNVHLNAYTRMKFCGKLFAAPNNHS